jgi:putative ABC transport system permease protein
VSRDRAAHHRPLSHDRLPDLIVRDRLAAALFRAWLQLLPRAFRERVAEELLEVFQSRRASARGLRETLRAWTVELGGVLITAVRARLDDPLGLHRPRSTPKGAHMERLLQDIRFGARFMIRRPSVTALAVLTLGLGIAASTAMFSVVDAVLLRPLPFPDPDELVSIYPTNPGLAGHPSLGDLAERGTFSGPELGALHADSRDVLSGLALLRPPGPQGMIARAGDGEPERIRLGGTNADLFARVLRVKPILGRVFSDADEASDDPLILITEGFWRRRFGADPGVIGSTIYFEENPRTVIGVLPESADLPGYPVEAWTLWGLDEYWSDHGLRAMGRLAPGVDPHQAAGRLSSVLADALPADHAGWTGARGSGTHAINVFRLKADEARGVRGSLWLLSCAAVVLLLVACANVAGLLVSSGIDRKQEMALRAAMGAERGRLVRQLLVESGLLALLAALAGVLLALGGTRALVLLAPDGVPRIEEAVIDPRALAFAVSLSVACGLMFGLAPALGVSRRGLHGSSGSRSRGTGNTRLQSVLVVTELALATLMLVGAGLLGRTFLALDRVDLGFAASRTLALGVTTPDRRLFGGVDMADAAARNAAVESYYRTLIEPIEALPGVRGVAITSNLPLAPDRSNNEVEPEGYDGPTLVAERRFVSPNYFPVIGLRLNEGRAFTPQEDQPGAEGKVVVSESLARAAWPGQSAIGKRFRYWEQDNVVVGVAADIRDEDVQSGTALAFYAPRLQAGQPGGRMVIAVAGDPTALIPAVRERVREADGATFINLLRPLSDFASEQIAGQRYRARLIVVFSTLATLFSLLGVYGITTRSVAARTRELGIRTALGARRDGLVAVVLGQALRLAVVGGVIGVGVSFVVTRSIETYLWGVEPTDPISLLGAGLLLAVAAVLSALGPALRAGRADPMQALKAE